MQEQSSQQQRRRSSPHRLSKVSAQDIEDSAATLSSIFASYRDHADGVTQSALHDFAAGCELLDRRLTRESLGLIFEKIRIGNKKALGEERLGEALRQIAIAKDVTYQELLQLVVGSEQWKRRLQGAKQDEIYENERYRPGVGW